MSVSGRSGGVGSSMTVCHGRGGNLRVPGVYELQSFGLESGKCSLFQFHTFVTWEGEVLACCHDLTGATLIGSLANDDVSVIAERKRKVLKNSMPFRCAGNVTNLKTVSIPSRFTAGRKKGKEQIFSSVREKRSQAGDWERGE